MRNERGPTVRRDSHPWPGVACLAPLKGQEEWDAYAAFMDALADEGLVLLGGPPEGTCDALFIVRAATPDEIDDRLLADPWTRPDLLRAIRIVPWRLHLAYSVRQLVILQPELSTPQAPVIMTIAGLHARIA
jgi:hypothetical protein